MKAVKVLKNENNMLETHILGDPVVTDKLCDYEFPGFSGFYAYIRADEYNICGIDSGHIFIFLDLAGYYSEEYGEYSLVPMIYYTNDPLTSYFDDFNEENKDLVDIDSMYILDEGCGFDIVGDTIKITSPDLLKFFSSFDNDIKEVDIIISDIVCDKFTEAGFRIIK